MKYPQTVIFLDQEITESSKPMIEQSHYCSINGKRFVYAADVYGFGDYLSPKKVFRSPLSLVKARMRCPHCGEQTGIVALEASGYVPCAGEKHDLALNIAFFLEGGVDRLMSYPVYVTYLLECPPDLLKQIRMHSFLYRKYDFGDDHAFFANACEYCKRPIDDFRVYYEMDAPLARCNPCSEREIIHLPYSMPVVVDAQFA